MVLFLILKELRGCIDVWLRNPYPSAMIPIKHAGGNIAEKKILVAGTETLPGAGLEILLNREDDLQVIGLESETEADLIKAIEHNMPSAVVMYRNRLAKEVNIQKLLAAYLNQPLIMVSTESNYIQIYSKHEFLLTKVTDLADVIRSL